MDQAAFLKLVLFGATEALRDAATREPDRVRDVGEFGFTPLHMLMTEDRPDAAEVLLAAGADVNARNDAGMTPLHIAQSPSLVAVLLRHGAELDARSLGGATPLLVQAGEQLDSGSLEVMAALIAAGADVRAARDDGKTALDIATQRKESKKIKLLESALGGSGSASVGASKAPPLRRPRR